MKKALSLVLTMCMVLSLFATFVVSASAEDAVVSVGATYTATAKTHDYGDWAGCSQNADKALTDSEKATDNQYMKPYNAYIEADVVGYGKTVSITMTLDKAYALTGFNVYTIGGADGSANPLSASVSVSTDGTNWSEAVETTVTTSTGSNTWGHNYTLAKYSVTVDAVNAQYVKFDIVSGGNQIFIDEIEAIGSEIQETVETKVIGLDRANHYDWTNKDFQSDAYTPTGASAGEILIAASVEEKTAAEGCFGGNIFDWWYAILAEWDATAKAYVITEIDLPGTDNGEAYETWTVNENKIVVLCNTGYSSTEVAGNKEDADVIKSLVVGDKLTINGIEFAALAETSGALTGVSLTVNAPAEEGGKVVITKGENVALNKTYEISGCGERTTYYAKLTDGKAVDHVCQDKEGDAAYFNNHAEWFGFYCNGTDASVINAPDKVGTATIDLTKATDIYSVKVNVFDGDMWGIVAPASVAVAFSNDGTTYTEDITVDVTGSSETNHASWLEFVLDEVVTAQYVKVTVNLNGTFAFINEIEVYEAVETIVSGGDEQETVKETITVDGDLTDTGWAKDKWIIVNLENGYLQNSYEIQQGTAKAAEFGYKYQFRADDTKFYGAIVVDGSPVAGGNGKGTFPRLWIRDNDAATVYTHFYNIEFDENGNVITGAKYNQSTTENSGANIENSTFVAFAKEVDGKTVFEFSVDIAEFCADGTFDYFLSVSQWAGENYGCLYHPASEIGPTDPNGGENHIPHLYLPFRTWHSAKDATINVEDILLGEVVVDNGNVDDGETDDDLGDAGIYAIAALALVALIGTAVVIKKRA